LGNHEGQPEARVEPPLPVKSEIVPVAARIPRDTSNITAPEGFVRFKLRPDVLKALGSLGLKKPTHIQVIVSSCLPRLFTSLSLSLQGPS